MRSSELGASLLAETRERNKKLSEEARRRARKDTWKALGAKVLIGATNDLLERRQQEFLTNEDNLRAKLEMKTANDFASKISGEDAAANEFAGGADAYWTAKAKPMVEEWMNANYSESTSNAATYERYKNILASSYGQELKKNHAETFKATKNFLEETGGLENYTATMKRQKPTTISGFVGNFIGKATGILEKDDAVLTAKQFENEANKLDAFHDAYSKLGSSSLAEFVTKNNLAVSQEGLGTKMSEYSEPVTVDGPYGEELQIVVTSFDENGNKSFSTVKADSSGNMRFSAPQVQAQEKIHSMRVSKVSSDARNPIRTAGQHIIQSLKPEQINELTEHVKTIFEDDYKGKTTNKEAYNNFVESKNNMFYSNAGVASQTLQNQGFTTPTAEVIASELIMNSIDPANKGTKVLDSVGNTNPYHTLHAIHNGVMNDRMQKPVQLVDRFLRGNDLNFLYAYKSESMEGRGRIDDILEKTGNFGMIGVDDSLNKVHQAVKLVVQNPGNVFSGMKDEEALRKAYDMYAEEVKGEVVEGQPKGTKKVEPLTQEQIDLWSGRNTFNAKKIEGLSNSMIDEAYGSEIRRYYNVVTQNKKTASAIKGFFMADKERRRKLESMTYAERQYYNKTGKFPEEY